MGGKLNEKFSIILGAIILVLFVTLVIWGVYCDNTIAITNYCVNNTKNDAKLKFVVITDLHNKEYGEKNADLAELVKEQNRFYCSLRRYGQPWRSRHNEDERCA